MYVRYVNVGMFETIIEIIIFKVEFVHILILHSYCVILYISARYEMPFDELN